MIKSSQQLTTSDIEALWVIIFGVFGVFGENKKEAGLQLRYFALSGAIIRIFGHFKKENVRILNARALTA